MGKAGPQFAEGHEPLLPRQEALQQMRLGDIGEQHHLAALGEFAPRKIDESPGAKLRVLADRGVVDRGAREHGLERLPQQGLAEQRDRGRIRFLDVPARIEHQDAAGKSFDERRQARGQTIPAGVRLVELVPQLRHLPAQRIERSGKLLGYRAERAKRRGELAARIVDQPLG